jgi:hypothetical protein
MRPAGDDATAATAPMFLRAPPELIIFANIEPAFDALRQDTRFIAMLRGARA